MNEKNSSYTAMGVELSASDQISLANLAGAITSPDCEIYADALDSPDEVSITKLTELLERIYAVLSSEATSADKKKEAEGARTALAVLAYERPGIKNSLETIRQDSTDSQIHGVADDILQECLDLNSNIFLTARSGDYDLQKEGQVVDSFTEYDIVKGRISVVRKPSPTYTVTVSDHQQPHAEDDDAASRITFVPSTS